ncbi:MAG: DUF3027 domain-containing protein [bacterium]|nr:DUF3027 domain-containing protein [bacterium]
MASDQVLAAAVDQAREAASEATEHGIGEHLGFYLEGDRVGTHMFAASEPGYVGWHWAVTLARTPRSRKPTINEVELLPGRGALLAPEWLPWAERLRPGDVGPGDVLPYQGEDHRLDQGYEQTDDVEADRVAIYELGLGRARVLSADGRAEAFTRWYEGEGGPNAEAAKKATAPCSTCGFFMKMSGSARRIFGVCANEWSPSDGRVVSLDHGCGAHSETDVRGRKGEWQQSEPVIDEGELDSFELGSPRSGPVSETPDDGGPAPSSETEPPVVGGEGQPGDDAEAGEAEADMEAGGERTSE